MIFVLQKVKVHGCANGKLCEVMYDDYDDTYTVFSNGLALGYFYAVKLESRPEFEMEVNDE